MKLALKVFAGLFGALFIIILSLAIYIYATALEPDALVGFQQVEIPDPGHNPITAAIWYPTTADPGFALLGLTGEKVATNGAVAGNRLPLIIISHGTGASLFSHADTALALAQSGFVVIAPMHTGDNFQDDSDVGKPDWLVNRSRHVERAIDLALHSWKDRSHIDPGRVGVFGFSAGATTALINIGGTPDLQLIASHCAGHPEFVCKLTWPAMYRNLKPPAWHGDTRIGAAVIAAPGLGFIFAPDGLSAVHVPVQIWQGTEDQTVPSATNAELIRRYLAEPPETHLVPGAVHYSFLAPCGLIGPPPLCRDSKGFDRQAFHKIFNDAVVRFFRATLSGASLPAA